VTGRFNYAKLVQFSENGKVGYSMGIEQGVVLLEITTQGPNAKRQILKLALNEDQFRAI